MKLPLLLYIEVHVQQCAYTCSAGQVVLCMYDTRAQMCTSFYKFRVNTNWASKYLEHQSSVSHFMCFCFCCCANPIGVAHDEKIQQFLLYLNGMDVLL